MNGTVMPSGDGAEHAIHAAIGEMKRRDEAVVVGFEAENGDERVITFDNYVTRVELEAALRSDGRRDKVVWLRYLGSYVSKAAVRGW